MTSTAAAVDGNDLVSRVRAAQLPSVAVRRRIRRRANASLRDMGLSLGVSPMTVLRWEQGTSEPRLENAIAYRRLLDAPDEATR
jgi:DNA-binding XRE family transcriptional regulator